jgi:alkanesulfonate monooxygenase SsuD/methylene tetrahydromethanopterin reductase-like flavin-dependent oxidoreductase (luciferase family)
VSRWESAGGWYEHEWRAYGYGFPSAGVRLARLDEGVQIMRDAWRDGVVTFSGKEYQADGAIVQPTPLQSDGIPLWIAGGGEQKTLRIAAKYAQYTNYTPDPEEFKHKSEILAQHCTDVGTDFDAIVRSANFTAIVGDSDADVKARLARIRDRMVRFVGEQGADAMAAATANEAATGTPKQVAENLRRLRDLGCEYAIMYFPEAAYDRSGVELFEREVIPALS